MIFDEYEIKGVELDIAKTADFIVNGYAFTSENNQIRVFFKK